jgi:hypothetical protein
MKLIYNDYKLTFQGALIFLKVQLLRKSSIKYGILYFVLFV